MSINIFLIFSKLRNQVYTSDFLYKNKNTDLIRTVCRNKVIPVRASAIKKI